MPQRTHHPTLTAQTPLVWIVAYIALTTTIIITAGITTTYLVATLVPGLAPAGIQLLAMTGIVAISPAIATTILQTLYTPPHNTTHPTATDATD